MVTRLRSGSQLCAKHRHQVHAILPSHKIMSSTCHTIHYDASQYRYTRLQFVICNTKVAMPRATLCVVLCAIYILYIYTGQCPPHGTSLEVSLRPPISLPLTLLPAPLPRSVAPSLLRSFPPSPLSLAQSMPTFLPHSFPSSTLPPFLHSRSNLPYIIDSSLPPLAPSLPHPPLAPSLPSFTASLPACLPPAVQFNVHLCVWQAALSIM